MTPLQSQILSAINSIRPELYGSDFSLLLLKHNGFNRSYDPLVTLLTDFICSLDRSGNVTLMVMTDAFNASMSAVTHFVFQDWVYQTTEPARPAPGPFPMWKVTGRPLGSKYIAEP